MRRGSPRGRARPGAGGDLEALEAPANGEPLEVLEGENLDVHAQALGLAHLPPLAVLKRRPHDRALDVHAELRKEEVRRERLQDRSVVRSLEDERVRLVLPPDPVLVEDSRQLALDRMREVDGDLLPHRSVMPEQQQR